MFMVVTPMTHGWWMVYLSMYWEDTPVVIEVKAYV